MSKFGQRYFARDFQRSWDNERSALGLDLPVTAIPVTVVEILAA